ncbi:DUF4388 domain-containing protein [Haliangium sp.]|uniref:DUF4388 domain-containing protein n=1 Tax=Haliangium sp. TaxID=2663208 RepID=UPI003D0F7EC6
MGSDEASLSGNLADFAAIDIIRFLCQSRRSGQLRICSGVREARLSFRDGGIVAAWRRGAIPLGSLLVQRSVVSADALDDALRAQQDTRPRRHIGSILVEGGWASADEVEAVVAMQIREALYAVLSWEAGRFSFSLGTVGFDGEASYVPSRSPDTQQVLIEVAQVRDELRRFLSE